ncbi:MAG: translation elongation factor Ts, partial [Gammaproteobacteria bacterium]|nr:translation elongation factor Ts [Gammaproteobacteria bacterium]
NGDIDAAIEQMRKSGMAKADKKAGRIAADGIVMVLSDVNGKKAVIVEVNSETDFVAKGDDFLGFAKQVAAKVLESGATDIESINGLDLGGQTVDEARRALISKLGENINVRRATVMECDDGGVLGTYSHGSRIGVLIQLEGGDEDLAKDLAMHIAASKPVCVSADQVSSEEINKEREIFSAQAKESGKPDNIIEKMVEGRIKKFINEVTLMGQPFVKDPDTSVEKLVKSKGARVIAFQRMEVGEGIEKKEENFADEVMAQVKGI